MRLVLPYCVTDADAALRLIRWIGFLSEECGNTMRSESVLIVAAPKAAKLAAHQEITALAQKIFGEATLLVPEPENETGWPGSANWMFSSALIAIERAFQDDMGWLEPDAVPLSPGWYSAWKKEWEQTVAEGLHFLGGNVLEPTQHMTGVAIYGRNWREIAPSLVTCPDSEAFDVWSAAEVIPFARFTPLIQHVFHRHEPRWEVPSLKIIDERAAIFHQDKKGKIIRLIDQTLIHSRFAKHPIFHHSGDPILMSRKFYSTQNATKAVKAHGKRFVFDALPEFGGSIPGVYSTEDDSAQVALDDMAANPTTGVKEISQEEWEAKTKKKFQPPPSSTSGSSNGTSNALNLPLLQTPSKQPARLVAEGAPRKLGGETVPGPGLPTIKDISEVLKIDTVQPAQPAKAEKRPKKKG